MRRLCAAGIDYIISYVLSVIVFCMFISIWKMIRMIQGIDLGKNFMPTVMLLVMLLLFVSFILTNFTYSVFFDRFFQGYTIGKRIMRSHINAGIDSNKENRRWIIKHALFRTIASLFYVITALYYIVALKMPYDKFCGVISEKKVKNVHIETTKELGKCKRRLIAVIIDYFVLLLSYTIINFAFLFYYRKQSEILYHILSTSLLFILVYLFIYFFIMDYFYHGSSIGKKKAGIKLLVNQEEFNIRSALIHALLKTSACCIWPVSLIFYLSKDVMFYDKWMKLEVVITKKVQ